MKKLTFNKFISLLSPVLIIINFGVVLYYFPSLPEHIHSHFNFLGRADDKANRFVIFLFPVLSLIIYFSLGYIIRKPERMNFPVRVTEEYRKELYSVGITMTNIIRFLLVSLFLFLSGAVVYSEMKGVNQINISIVYLFIIFILLTLFAGIKKMYDAGS
ncbi:MAG: DUF1648 domain-containing protein [Chlorobi bacterium]|nr:DUF1648 domain-containing protein [Chlorobiota bacterium]